MTASNNVLLMYSNGQGDMGAGHCLCVPGGGRETRELEVGLVNDKRLAIANAQRLVSPGIKSLVFHIHIHR